MAIRMLLAAALVVSMALAFAPHDAAAQGQQTASASAKKPGKSKPRIVVRRDRGYGFLPGYRPPEQPARDQPSKTYHYWNGYTWDGYPVGSYGTGGYGGMWYRGRFSNGLGPCWSRTPIGPMWNCG